MTINWIGKYSMRDSKKENTMPQSQINNSKLPPC